MAIEEDTFINYGFLPAALQALMHPRLDGIRWPPARKKRAMRLLEFRELGAEFDRARLSLGAHER